MRGRVSWRRLWIVFLLGLGFGSALGWALSPDRGFLYQWFEPKDELTDWRAVIYQGDLGHLKSRLQNGLNPNWVFEDKSLLCIASEVRVPEAVQLLLEHRADSNFAPLNSDPPLICALGGGDTRIVEMLLSAQAYPWVRGRSGLTALHVAAISKQTDALRMLLNHSAQLASLDLKDPRGLTPLHQAVRMGCLDCAKDLFAAGASPSYRTPDRESILHLAVGAPEEDLELVRWAIRRMGTVRQVTTSGTSPLMEAARLGRSETVTLLVGKGASLVRKNNKGEKALDFAARSGDLGLMKLLTPKEKVPKKRSPARKRGKRR